MRDGKLQKFLVSQYIVPLIVLISVCNFTKIAFCATIRVPAEHATIQSAIYTASSGDTILVADGVYTGYGNKDINFGGLAITLKSENGPSKCIIDCQSEGRGFKFFNDEGLDSVLSGFTIKNGFPDGYENEDGGAIYICPGSSPTIENCVIENNGNTDDGNGGGIMIDGIDPYQGVFPTFPMIKDCVISNNQALHAGGIRCSFAYPTISNCRIENNTGITGGIKLYESNAKIESCFISGNSASLYGGGISIDSGSSAVISNCIISNNISNDCGGGVHSFISAPQFTNCLITNNTSSGWGNKGGGIYCSSSPKFTNCTFAGNMADTGGDFYLFSDSSPIITNCILWSTDTPIYFGSGDPVITYSCIYGGYFGDGNINKDPKFVGMDNYRLTASSPCIDSGASSGAPDTDIDGTQRPQGIGYDIGGFEYFEIPTPTVSTLPITAITQYSAQTGGDVSFSGGSEVTDRGVCWSRSANPTINDNKTMDGAGIGSFTSMITNLTPESDYYVRAYAINIGGTSYGENRHFNTLSAVNNNTDVETDDSVSDSTDNGMTDDDSNNSSTDPSNEIEVESIPPKVTSTSPSDGATGVVINSTVSVAFSKDIDSSTITLSTFQLDDNLLTGNSISYYVTYDENHKIATLTPSFDLNYDTVYTATITTELMDLAGNKMKNVYSWSFTTESKPVDDDEILTDGNDNETSTEVESDGGDNDSGCFINSLTR
ncbi:MAG: Ig-like domain-containing protein [bacterium]